MVRYVQPFKRLVLDQVEPVSKGTATVLGIIFLQVWHFRPRVLLDCVHKEIVALLLSTVSRPSRHEEVLVAVTCQRCSHSGGALFGKLNMSGGVVQRVDSFPLG